MAAPPAAPAAYAPGVNPATPEDLLLYVGDEVRKIAVTLATLTRLTPQTAVKAPLLVVDGMVRLARSPWRPAGGVVDAWVYYDLPTATWKFV